MYRAVLPETDIKCDRYERGEYGVELYSDSDEFLAFVPYANLVAILNEEADFGDEPSII